MRLAKAVVDGIETVNYYFRLPDPLIVTHFSQAEVTEQTDAAINTILEQVAKWVNLGLGWVIQKVNKVWLDFVRYQPIRGGSYLPLPKKLRDKQAIINIKNKEDQCLRWALRAALFPTRDTKHADRPSKYQTNDGLDFTGISFPAPLNQLSRG